MGCGSARLFLLFFSRFNKILLIVSRLLLNILIRFLRISLLYFKIPIFKNMIVSDGIFDDKVKMEINHETPNDPAF